ncbi:MAG: copper amine oxidase N-terminal domain-containing protein [Clostridia bacterium]|nr:copper amine oxidase N-terminal domain-containing protein [Clostridia bacterium]
MNKKIISLLMGVAMLTASVPTMATTEGIVQDDILLISENPEAENGVFEEALFTYVSTVSAIDGQLVTITIDGQDVTFGLAEGVELGEIAVGDTVKITSPSTLETKDIKSAASIEKIEEAVADEVAVPSYYRHIGTVGSVAEGSINVVVDGDMVVTFAVTDTTAIYTIAGDKAEAVKEGDMVIVASKSPLMSRDIKEAAAIVITNEEAQTSIYVDTFAKSEDALVSADGELVLNMENADEYDGKKLLVFYDFATMSIPAQTNPIKVVVLEDVKAAEKVTISFNVGSSMVNINGEDVEVEKPYIVGVGVTLVPIRVISESFGAEVNWDGETKTVTVVDGDTTIVVTIGSKTATVNGEEKELEEAPELTENGFTMIPLRFISENLGATVGYVHETQAISVER